MSSPPIQDIEIVDIVGKRNDGGVDLFIVTSSRLDASPETQQLLLDKIQSYLEQLNTDGFQTEFNDPTPENTRIVLLCDERPDTAIEELVTQAMPWVEDNNARLELRVGNVA